MGINIMNEQEAATLQKLIAASQHIVICCHRSPDGDAMGSSLAWQRYLLSLGKDAVVCVPDQYPDFLQWLPGANNIVRYDKHPDRACQLFHDADLVCCLDFNAPGRLDEMEHLLTECKAPKVMLDHHLAPSLDAVVAVSQPQLCSASEVVFRVVWQLGGFEQMDRLWAICVYCGMMTDTGGFTYNSSYPEIYFIIGQLLTKNFDKDKIYRNVFNNYSASALRLRGYIMSECLHVHGRLHASYYCVTRDIMKNHDFKKGDLEGLVNEPLRIKGHRLSISLREDTERDNFILVSLRSVDDFPCNKMAEQFFNGGGHKNASGGKLFCSMAEAEQVANRAIEAFASMLA